LGPLIFRLDYVCDIWLVVASLVTVSLILESNYFSYPSTVKSKDNGKKKNKEQSFLKLFCRYGTLSEQAASKTLLSGGEKPNNVLF
jgi:hypothetical protein